MNATPLDAALNAIAAAVGNSTDEAFSLIAAKCRALMVGYAARWSSNDLIPQRVEALVSAPLMNPDTLRPSRKLTTAGKLDAIATRGGRVVLIDHKSTSEEITDPAGAYWRQLVVESQPSHYMLLEWQNGRKIDEAVWDVMRKPSIGPRQFKSKAERASISGTQTYFGRRVSDATLAWVQANDRENLELYEARLVNDCCDVRPDWYFQRRTIPRLDSELFDYARDLWQSAQLILDARRFKRWPKHPASCMAYGRPCQYLGICSGFDRSDSDRWQIRPDVHAELPGITDGRDVLTFSSVRTFQACPRKFYYRYALGIERVDEPESEALRFGHLWHLALEAYWGALIPKEELQHGNGDTAGANSATDQRGQAAVPF